MHYRKALGAFKVEDHVRSSIAGPSTSAPAPAAPAPAFDPAALLGQFEKSLDAKLGGLMEKLSDMIESKMEAKIEAAVQAALRRERARTQLSTPDSKCALSFINASY